MNSTQPDISRLQPLCDLVVELHNRGDFIIDPSPSAVRWVEDKPLIADKEIEKRSHTEIPHLALSQLWSLMHGYSSRLKVEAGREYLRQRELELDLDDALRAHWEQEVERCFHKNRDFKVVKAGDLVWHVRSDLLDQNRNFALEDPDSLLEPDSPKLIKDGGRTTVALAPGGAVLKRFNLRKVRNLVKNQLGMSRARRAFQKAYHLELLGIRTPRAIAWAERREFGLPTRSYLLMEYLPDSVEGYHAVRDLEDDEQFGGANGIERRRLLSEGGKLIGRLHGAGFSNRDLKASNLLVSPEGQIWLIDLDGISHRELVSDAERIKNLRRIVRDLPHYGNLGLKDSMCFVRAYTRALRRGSAKELFRQLAEKDPV